MYDVLDIANYVVGKCIKEKKPISNLKLQRIFYVAQVYNLEINNQWLYSDDIEARGFGPCIPKLYYEYCGFGAMPISLPFDFIKIVELDVNSKALIDFIIDKIRPLEPWNCSKIVTPEDGAWHTTWSKYLKGREERNDWGSRINYLVIPKELIKGDYSYIINKLGNFSN